jgi:hypothetical protein
MTIHCPKCDADISDSYQDDEPDVGVIGGWYCDACDVGYGESELGDDDDHGGLPPAPPREASLPIGTKLSDLSGRPGHPGYEAWVRLCKSYGYD